ncbi:hypothetical protein Cgig2_025235 [Carnegiea gigantea]|uniref:Uncharacterized protein n=1 Tax=Carnegiea gigantea TaxID=171969 RepID=A0A9Q1JGL6_9CARY|nr:hypothetical protein Cgig2_025235 [Carnegiea gigantea]
MPSRNSSMLHRRMSSEVSIANEIVKYMNIRKELKKAIRNCLKDVKTSDKNEKFDAIDFDEALNSLVFHEKKTGFNMMQMENLRSDIVKLEFEIHDLNKVLDLLYRLLVKTRATFLNVLSKEITIDKPPFVYQCIKIFLGNETFSFTYKFSFLF